MTSSATFVVEQAGPLTSTQDGGRLGQLRFGIPASGPVDRLSYEAAVRSFGGEAINGAIELSLGGVTLRCIRGETLFAVCGGGFTVELDGERLGSWIVASISAGMTLQVRPGKGNWSYLTFAGHIEAPTWLGSVSRHVQADLGGRRLVEGDMLNIAKCRQPASARQGVQTVPPPPGIDPPISHARVILGPQERFFSAAAVDTLLTERFRPSLSFDRMGLVLDGPIIPPDMLDMPSEPAVRGALQVDGAGRTTLLLADHQTAGGYPKIAVMLAVDADRIAQLPVGNTFQIVAVDAEEARRAALAARRARDQYHRMLLQPFDLDARLSNANLIDGAVDALDPISCSYFARCDDDEECDGRRKT